MGLGRNLSGLDRLTGPEARHVPSRGGYVIGEIIAPRPLVVLIEGLEISRDRIFINEWLLKGWTREYDVERARLADVYDRVWCAGGEGNIDGEINAQGGEAELKPVEDYLKPGDSVLLIPSVDRQLYYLLCKVVKAP